MAGLFKNSFTKVVQDTLRGREDPGLTAKKWAFGTKNWTKVQVTNKQTGKSLDPGSTGS